jgi:ribosome-binding ATPase YchF (GTP1/OBG family)
MQREGKKAKSGDKDARALIAVLEKLMPHLDQGQPVRSLAVRRREGHSQAAVPAHHQAAMYVANVSEDGFSNNPYLDKLPLGERKAPGGCPVRAIEAEIADLDDADKAEFLAEMGLEEPGLTA